jgi:hypothetical protein
LAGAKIFGLAPKYELVPITGAPESAALTSKAVSKKRIVMERRMLK